MIEAVLRVERSDSGRLTGAVVHDGREIEFDGTLELLRVVEDLIADGGRPADHCNGTLT